MNHEKKRMRRAKKERLWKEEEDRLLEEDPMAEGVYVCPQEQCRLQEEEYSGLEDERMGLVYDSSREDISYLEDEEMSLAYEHLSQDDSLSLEEDLNFGEE
ncbi:hypothetical protein FRC18_012402 [Serendipita sp. 400]|nr:hypothetical protein FRC18_012402 [Serendipita sp. 400]